MFPRACFPWATQKANNPPDDPFARAIGATDKKPFRTVETETPPLQGTSDTQLLPAAKSSMHLVQSHEE